MPSTRLLLTPILVVVMLAATLNVGGSVEAQDNGDPSDEVTELLALRAQFLVEQLANAAEDGLASGVATGDLQITQGSNVADGEFPFLVSVVVQFPERYVFLCGGALITPRVVLTAAHCFVGLENAKILVGLGSRYWESPLQVIESSRRPYSHPEYRGRQMNDIAVLVLDEEAAISHPNIGLIPLGPALVSGVGSDSMTVMGWGDTDPLPGDENATQPQIARKTTVTLRDCNLDLGPGYDENDWNHLCAFDRSGEDACQGDSGGPAIQEIGGRPTLVALVQGGPPDGSCGLRNYGIYQRVSPHTLWVKRPSQDPIKCLGEWVTIDMNLNGGNGNGTYGNDVIAGTNSADKIYGGGGDDYVCGYAGNDRIFGGQGHDLLHGGSGNDVIHGNRGVDIIGGSSGDDKIFGYAGNDILLGGDGADRLHGNFGNDHLDGEDGNDSLFGYGDDDFLEGGDGLDLMVGNFGDDILHGQGGNDSMYGSDGADILRGGQGNDLMQGNSGPDTLQGGAGNDALDGGIGSDQCEGNHGTDTAFRCEAVSGIP